MTLFPRLRAALPATTAFSLAMTAAAASATPVHTHLEFSVLKDGSPVGRHQVDMSRDGGDEEVAIKTNVVVKIAMVPVYRFEHQGRELWRNGQLVGLHSETDDDGTKHSLDAGASAGSVQIVGDGARSQADAGIIPASLWNHDLVKQNVLLNTLTGKLMKVQVTDLGTEDIQSQGKNIQAHHYRMSGELERELWYDPGNTLVQVRFKANDSSTILYVLL
jgi:hypothetical protein